MFHGIEMNEIDMTGIIQAVANRRFPLSSLPDAPFAFGDVHGGQLLGLPHRFRKRDLDRFPTGRVIDLGRRQCPDTMHVIGQHHPAIDMKRTCRSNLAHRRAQCLDLVDEQATLTFQQINYEEIRSSRNAIAAVVGDGRILPEPMSAYGGMALGHPGRRAFPPYGPQVSPARSPGLVACRRASPRTRG